MNKKKFAVIVISLVILIAVSLSGGYYFNKFKTERNSYDEDEYTPPTAEEIEMEVQEFDIKETRILDWSKDIQKLTKKYHFFEDMYNSDKKIFIYGYEKHDQFPMDVKTHKEIQAIIKKNHFDDEYKIIAMTDFKKTFIKMLKANNIPVDEDGNCGDETPQERDINQIIEEAIPCYLNSCIIDPKKKQSIMIPKFARVIEKGLRDYK